MHIPSSPRAYSSAILAILAYGSTSLALVLFNKMILSIWKFKFASIMLLCEMLFSVILSELLRVAGYIHYPKFKREIFLTVAPLSLIFVLNVIFGLVSLRVVSVPIFTTLRRLGGIITMALEYFVLKLVPSKSKVASLLVILFGAIIAGAGDLSFDLTSYSCVLLNNLLTSGYLILMKKMDNAEVKLNANGKVFYNSLISVPWLLLISLIDGEFASALEFEYLGDLHFQLSLLASCVLAFLLNASMFWCTSATSPLTTSVTGQVKNVLVTILGLFLFGDVQPTIMLIVGLTVCIIGSICFSYVEINAQKRPTAVVYTKVEQELSDLEDQSVNEDSNTSQHIKR
jgi:solute carrier family 35 protein